jgi:hypothetical protein
MSYSGSREDRGQKMHAKRPLGSSELGTRVALAAKIVTGTLASRQRYNLRFPPTVTVDSSAFAVDIHHRRRDRHSRRSGGFGRTIKTLTRRRCHE